MLAWSRSLQTFPKSLLGGVGAAVDVPIECGRVSAPNLPSSYHRETIAIKRSAGITPLNMRAGKFIRENCSRARAALCSFLL